MGFLEYIGAHLGELRLAVALLAAAVAFLAILSHRRTTARKSTLDFILKHELHDPIWLDLRLKVRPILKDAGKWGAIVEAESTADKQDVLAWLNHHEIVAVGVKHRALDRNLYFDWLGSLYRADWELAHSFVRTLRDQERRRRLPSGIIGNGSRVHSWSLKSSRRARRRRSAL